MITFKLYILSRNMMELMLFYHWIFKVIWNGEEVEKSNNFRLGIWEMSSSLNLLSLSKSLTVT